MTDFLNDLNEEQRKAVLAIDGPVMVIAGAGSGKTRVLTYRVAHLIANGVDPFSILALTFTNKAAKEMKERIVSLVNSSEAHSVWMGTFHSVFARVLRIEGHRLGYPSNFTIYDTDDSKRLIKSLVKENNLDEKIYQPGYILHRISSAKTSLITPQEYIDNAEVIEYDRAAGKPHTGQLYLQYQTRLFRASAMDFDDLLFNMNVLLRDFPEVLYKYQQKFRYILVDEYQDTNYAQYLIVRKLAANNENLCVVGDDAQSIYAFRGANIQNILNFRHDYPDHQVFKLEQNYRSTKTIVNAANKIIAQNKQQIFKEVWTQNEEGSKISVLRSTTDNEEGTQVAQAIFEEKMNRQQPNNAFAVLYRTNAQSRSIEEALRRMNIPCRIYGGISFYQRKEIKDLLAYFRLVINPKDEDALLRIINYPARGIGKTTVERLVAAAGEYKMSMFELIGKHDQFDLGLTGGTLQKLLTFHTMIRSFAAMLPVRNAYDLARHIATSTGILKDLYEDKTPEGVSRFENIEELLNGIKEFSENSSGIAKLLITDFSTDDVGSPLPPVIKEELVDIETGELDLYEKTTEDQPDPDKKVRTLDQFMQEVSLLTDLDYSEDENPDKVTLMTIHQAKGLEFPYVYIVGLEENLFPSIQSLNSRADLEEERRLFYVAITRAEKKLTLSYSETRYKWGNLTVSDPSRFLSEIPEEFLDLPRRPQPKVQSLGDKNRSKPFTIQEPAPKINLKNFSKLSAIPATKTPAASPVSDEDIQVGMEVEHDRFGKGKILALEGEGPNRKATVQFAGVGQKQLLLRFARLKPV